MQIPGRFIQGEILSSKKLNEIIDWIQEAQRVLNAARVSTGPGLTHTSSPTGTTISLIPRIPRQQETATVGVFYLRKK